jgi:cytochrome c
MILENINTFQTVSILYRFYRMQKDFSQLRYVCLIALGILGLTTLHSRQVFAAETLDWTRFERVSLARELIQPMEFEIAKDGSIFLIELAGRIKRIDPFSGVQELVGELEVTTVQENGLIGLALSPDFDGKGWIYLQYSPPDFSGQRISRFWYGDGQLEVKSEQRLLQFEEQRQECCHHAGGMEFGPDGCLYIATGDNTNPFDDSAGYAPIDQREGREPWDAQRSSGNTQSFNGKILRIRPQPDGTYTIPDGNLFPQDGSVGLPEIYVMGCRNPWRISLDQRTGFLYWGDVGPDAGQDGPRGPRGYDEINQARHAGNFGWPFFIADNKPYNDYNFETKEVGISFDPQHPINASKNNTGATHLPPAQPAMIYYPSAASPEFPVLGMGGRTACAGPVYYFESDSNENRLPQELDRHLFIYEWSRNWIMAVQLGEDNLPEKITPFWKEQKFTRPIQVRIDRTGRLFVLLYGETWGVNTDAELIRIDYIRGNRSPVAVVESSLASGREPLKVMFSGNKSYDRDGDELDFLWSYSRVQLNTDDAADLVPDTVIGLEREFEWIFDEPGVYSVHLDVWDPLEAQDRASITVIVGNEAPEVRFVSPQDGRFYEPGMSIDYEIEIIDREDGTSSADLAERLDLEELDPSAVKRTLVRSVPVDLDGRYVDEQSGPMGLRLIRQSDCLNCHAQQRSLVGPSFLEIANKYRDQADAFDRAVGRVVSGSTGVWGKVPMLPHSQLPLDDVRQMVDYVFSMTENQNDSSVIGLRNSVPLPPEAQCVRLEASYTDAGFGEIPALTGTAVITLRARKIQAEAVTEYRRAKPLDSGSAEGGKFMGAISHRGFLKFPSICLDQVAGIRLSVASAGAGGQVEFRLDSPRGDLIGTLDVDVNGHWEQFYQTHIPIVQTQGCFDVYAVFLNSNNKDGLMNVDWIEFLSPDMLSQLDQIAVKAEVSAAEEAD